MSTRPSAGCGIMTVSTESPTFTKKDRDAIRLEFMDRFGSAVSINEGFWLRLWRSGPLKGQPKIPAAVQSLIDRGLVRVVEEEDRPPRARFTQDGFRALVAMADDPRAFQP